jgi:hypothetical protein
MDLVLRVLLVRGPVSQRLFLMALYLVCGTFYLAFDVLFSSPPPDDYLSRDYCDRMDRGMALPFWNGLQAVGLACLGWMGAVGVFLLDRKQRRGAWSWVWAGAAPAVFFACWWLYGEALNGRARAVHVFFYELGGGQQR